MDRIAAFFSDDNPTALVVRLWFSDVASLHEIRDLVIMTGEQSLEAGLTADFQALLGNEPIFVHCDRTRFAETYESSILKLDVLTDHQERKLQEIFLNESPRIHLRAPAGAGKTFVALHLMVKVLKKDRAKVLFVAENPSLAYFVGLWLAQRIQAPRWRKNLKNVW